MLSKLQKLREEREQGFTLIELLVVILIIGILAAIAIPAFLNQRKSAVDSAVESDLRNVATAVETAAIGAKGQAYFLTTDGTEVVLTKGSVAGGTEIASEPIKLSDGSALTVTEPTGNDTNGWEVNITNEGGNNATSTNAGISYKSNGGLTDTQPTTP